MSAARTSYALRFLVTLLACVNVVFLINRFLPDQVHVDITIHKSDFGLDTLSQFTRSVLSEPPSKKISRIVHLTWKDLRLPNATVKWVRRWLQYAPGWKYIFWTDAAARRLVQLKFPELLPMFDAYPKPIYRADAMRYFILYEYGGVYADLDVEPLKDFEPVRDEYACVLSQEPDEHAKLLNDIFGDEEHRIACNAFMACRPKHPFFYTLIRNLAHNHNISERFHHEAGRTILSSGPGMLTRMFTIYRQNALEHFSTHPEDVIQLAPASKFTPIFDHEKMDYIKFRCERLIHLMPKFKKLVCNDLKTRNWTNIPRSDSYTTHHWFHSWLSGVEGAEGRNEGLTNLTLQEVLPGIVIADDLEELQ